MTKKNSKYCILIVDDVPGNIKTLLGMLASDYRVLIAKSGEKALSVVESESVDLILLDVLMPEMDGFEVCRQLKESEKSRDIPIIFVTAKNEQIDAAKGYELGAVDYLTKPINPEVVHARIQKILPH